MTYRITIEEKVTAEDRRILGGGINQHVEGLFPGKWIKDITFFLRDEGGTIVGGVAGNCGSFGWLYVDALWVSEPLRGMGYGSKLLAMIESEAAGHGCSNVYLTTFSFEAPAFYAKFGYTVFAELEDFPPGHTRIFLRKTLI